MKEFAALKPYLYRYRVQYILGLLFLAIVDASQIFIPQITRNAINIISGGDFPPWSVIRLCVVMVLLMLVIAAGRFAWRRMIHGSSRKIEARLRQKLFEKLLTLNSDYYEKNKIGDLMARSINDISAVRMAIGWGVVAGIDGTVMAITILVIIFVQNPATAALAVIPLPLITVLIIIFGKIVAKYFKKAQEKYSGLSEIVQETFAGISVVKSFVKESYFMKKFADTNEDYKRANMDVVKVHGFFFPLVTFLAGIITLIVLLAGGRAVILGRMSVGGLVALLSYMQMLVWPMLGAGFTVNMVQRGAVSMKRINEVLDAEPAIKEPEGIKRGAGSKIEGGSPPETPLRSVARDPAAAKVPLCHAPVPFCRAPGSVIGTVELAELLNKDPVRTVRAGEVEIDREKGLINSIDAYYKNSGQNTVLRDGKTVIIGRKGIRSSIHHGYGKLKIDAFAAVPLIIGKGVLIRVNNNWKNRGYDSSVIAAPFVFEDKEYICEVVVNHHKDGSNTYYLHEVEEKEKLRSASQAGYNPSAPHRACSLIIQHQTESVNPPEKNPGPHSPAAPVHGFVPSVSDSSPALPAQAPGSSRIPARSPRPPRPYQSFDAAVLKP